MRLILSLLFLLTLTTYSSATYCLCKDGVADKDLQYTIDYACGVLKDCTQIHVKGPCFEPDTVKSHCDWAANIYFQKAGQTPESCNFSGTATTSQNPPSTIVTGCIFPSSPGSAGTPTTTGTTSGTTSGTQTFPGTPAFGPTGVFDPSSASSLFISMTLTLGFSVIAFLYKGSG